MIPAGLLFAWNSDGDAMLCSIAEPHVHGFITAELTMVLGSLQQKGQSDRNTSMLTANYEHRGPKRSEGGSECLLTSGSGLGKSGSS